jgi:hypothetical protein
MTAPALDPMRKPHRVTRRLIERDGDEAPRNLYAWFDTFNAQFFSGRLAAPMVWIAPTSSPRAEGSYMPRDVHGLQSVIRIRPSVYKLGDRFAVACLLHEMIHAYQHEVLLDMERGHKGHGPRFCETANTIGAAFGWPEVSPQGRGGKRRPEYWPELPDGPVRKLKAPEPEPVAAVEPEQVEPGDPDDGDADTAGSVASGMDIERKLVTAYLSRLAAENMTAGQREIAKLCQWLAYSIEANEHRTTREHRSTREARMRKVTP